MNITEMSNEKLAAEYTATRAAMWSAAGKPRYAGLKAWAREIQAEQYRRSIIRAREAFVDGLAELVSEALGSGVTPEEVQADVDGCLSVQLPDDEPGSGLPSWVDVVLDVSVVAIGDEARQAFEAETAAQFADGSGEMEMAGYPAGE